MRVIDDAVIVSASDIVASLSCEFALLRAFDVLSGRAPGPEGADVDEMLERTAELGDAHERRALEGMLAEHGEWSPDRRGGVYRMSGGWGSSTEELRALHRETLAALASGADVVYQAAFFDGEFFGRADFIVREAGPDGGARFAVYDTKLARHAKVAALIQLAAYADQLKREGLPVSPQMHLLLGDGSRASYPVDEILPVYLERRGKLIELLARHRGADAGAVTWGDERFVACGNCAACEPEVAAHRDLLLVANMRMSQRKKLLAAGVATIDDFAALPEPVRGVPESLWQQARMQCGVAETDGEAGGVSYAVHAPENLRMIPPPSPGDIFFDFEGDPLWAEGASPDWGLEYLFGVVERPAGGLPAGEGPPFLPFWAHDRRQEKQALKDFLGYVAERRAEYPDLHIYHYAAYERTALLRLAARHNYGEDQVDDLLRENVLVDLYAVVRKSLRVSQGSYSIKKLEPLYMGEHLREADVKDAAASVVAYANYCKARDDGEAGEAAEILRGIAEYNEYDCLSTLRLRDWLAGLGPERTGADGGPVPGGEPAAEQADDGELPDVAVEALYAFADGEEAAGSTGTVGSVDAVGPGGPGEGAVDGARTPDRQAVALAAAAVGYYQREDKPFWWAHFNRLSAPAGDWEQDRDVFTVSIAEVLDDWVKEPRKRTLSRFLRLTGSWAEGSTVTAGAGVWGLYDPPPEGLKTSSEAALGWGEKFTVEELGQAAGRDVVVVREALTKNATPYDQPPVALVPGTIMRTAGQRASVEAFARRLAAGLPLLPADCALDILRRVPPRYAGPANAPAAADPVTHLPPVVDGDYVEAIAGALLGMDDSYLAVQGPPGTGKTYVGSRVVARLIARGWRIGVVGQSHAVVNNMLRAAVAAGVPVERIGKKPSTKAAGRADAEEYPWKELSAAPDYSELLDSGGCLIGGTAWDFVSPERFGPRVLDLLVIDEAGQFSLANTIAVSRATSRLLLLGDPQQLPQVTQGQHPEPVDASVLGWLSEGHDTLPARFGYFLENSWRMHPELCRPVSRFAYEGRLQAHARTSERHLDVLAPGIHPVFVEHRDNATSSAEEAEEVLARIRALLPGRWTPSPKEASRAMTQRDVLVVAAYNAQVLLIRDTLARAGLGEIRVGTVDKFQGMEAPVVIVSMAASSPEEVPRGMEFLLSRNRVNVAVSRGEWAAVLIRSAPLTDYLPTTPASLADLGAFIALTTPAGGSGRG